MPRRSKPFRKLRKRLGKLWARVSEWPKGVAFWLLDTAEDALIGCLEAINRGQAKIGGEDWVD